MATQQELESLTGLIDSPSADSAEEVVAPTIVPPRGEVTLPLGVWNPMEGLLDTATVRELNGYDEEVLAKTRSLGAAMQMMLERSVVKIGNRPITATDLSDLHIGDRMELLLAIREVTWGEDIETFSSCTVCGEANEHEIAVSDIPRHEVADKETDRQFVIPLSRGEGRFHYPTGKLHKHILQGKYETSAELSTATIEDCAIEIPGMLLTTEEHIKKMSIRDRRAVIEYLGKHPVGPNLDAVPVTCRSCGEEYTLALSAGVLFPL